MRFLRFALAVVFCAGTAYAEFTFEDNGYRLTLLEDGKPVFAYNYTTVAAPAGVDAKFARACYIHPLHGLDGEVLTQDFPIDHRHHRGVFWAWPLTRIGDRPADVWACDGIYQHHEEWVQKEAGADKAVIAVRNFWSYADAPETPVGREEASYTVWPANGAGRAIDCRFKFTNITQENVTFLGAKGKGYGGFNYRPDASRGPQVFTTCDGLRREDALSYNTPWVDCTSMSEKDGKVAGVAVFQHAANPGYPFPGWILRHYGFLGACWPHEREHVVQPGESIELEYRLYVHRGNAETGNVTEAFSEYTAAVQGK